MLSDVLTTRINIRQIVITVHPGNTDLTEIGTTRSHKSSKKSEPI